jgi:hypothetical protein
VYKLPQSSVRALSENLPSLEALLRLQTECERIAQFTESKREPDEFFTLSAQEMDKIIFEIADLLKSPLGFDLSLAILPLLIEISLKGTKDETIGPDFT